MASPHNKHRDEEDVWELARNKGSQWAIVGKARRVSLVRVFESARHPNPRRNGYLLQRVGLKTTRRRTDGGVEVAQTLSPAQQLDCSTMPWYYFFRYFSIEVTRVDSNSALDDCITGKCLCC
jgi:hypothetical protein